MERQKAVIASALLAGSLMTGGVAFAISGGALESGQDNVGKLQPTTAVAPAPADPSNVVVAPQNPPTTSAAPAAAAPMVTAAPPTAPPSTTSQASPTAGGYGDDDSGEYESDDREQDGHEQEYEAHESEDDDD